MFLHSDFDFSFCKVGQLDGHKCLLCSLPHWLFSHCTWYVIVANKVLSLFIYLFIYLLFFIYFSLSLSLCLSVCLSAVSVSLSVLIVGRRQLYAVCNLLQEEESELSATWWSRATVDWRPSTRRSYNSSIPTFYVCARHCLSLASTSATGN